MKCNTCGKPVDHKLPDYEGQKVIIEMKGSHIEGYLCSTCYWAVCSYANSNSKVETKRVSETPADVFVEPKSYSVITDEDMELLRNMAYEEATKSED